MKFLFKKGEPPNEVCPKCKEGKHVECASHLPGMKACTCMNYDCIWIRAEENVN